MSSNWAGHTVDSFASALKINPWLQINGRGVWGGVRAPAPDKNVVSV